MCSVNMITMIELYFILPPSKAISTLSQLPKFNNKPRLINSLL